MKITLPSWALSTSLMLLAIGMVATAAGFTNWLVPSSSWLLWPPLLISGAWIKQNLLWWRKLARTELALVAILIAVWLMYFVGVLVPETGFDALWYHLPVAKAMAEQQGFVFIPAVYQSLNPLFSDLIFILGYQALGTTGAKLVAYLFGVVLVGLTYSLSRIYLPRSWSLALCLIVSSFQVVAWQSSSFYVDIAKAVWELSAVLILVQLKQKKLVHGRWLLIGGLFVGASLATKAFSLLLVPIFLMLVWSWQQTAKVKAVWLFLLGIMVIALPFYLRTWWYSGNLAQSLALHVAKLDEIGGTANLQTYVWERLLNFPKSLWLLTLGIPDYVSLVLLVLLPFTLWYVWQQRTDRAMMGLASFGLTQWCIWWLVPPLSTRYAISGFVILVLLTVLGGKKWIDLHREYLYPIVVVILLSVAINLAPRVFVLLSRQLEFVLGHQTQTEYLKQFRDGSIDSHLERWYQLTSS